MQKVLLASLALTGTLVSFAVERVDSFFDVSNSWQPRDWSSTRAWRGYQYAQGGGIATFSFDGHLTGQGDAADYVNQNVEGLTLKGLDLLNFYVMRFYGKAIAFCGGDPWVSAARTDTHVPHLDVTLKGDGANALAKKGKGKLTLNVPPSAFTSLDLVQGTLVITNDTGADTLGANGVPVTVKTGTLSFETANSGGAATVATVKNGGGLGKVAVKTGTLTAGSLVTERGGVLALETTSGGKFKVADKASETAPDGGLIALSGRDVSFLDYDATEGWKAGTSIPANARIFGTSGDAANTVTETGAISFDDAGYVWRPAGAGATTLKVTGVITAPGGVTFASAAATSATRPKVDLSAQSSLSGKTLSFVGVSVAADGLTPAVLNGSDLAVYGDGLNAAYGATLNLSAKVHKEQEYDFTLHLAGSDGTSAIDLAGNDWQYKFFKQKGTTFLDGDASLGLGDTSGGVFWFNGPVVGRGGLKLKAGNLRFYNSGNTFAGEFEVDDAAIASAWSGGCLGTGDVRLCENGKLYFCDLTAKPYALTNRFVGTEGWLGIQNSQVALAEAAQVRRAYVQNGATLTLGGDFRANRGHLALDSKIVADDKDVAFTIGCDDAGSRLLAGQLADGANGGRLSLVKLGSDTLVVDGTNNAYSGKTEVRGGTLKLGGDVFDVSDLVFWGDAADASTLTVDGDGKVTEWRSKVGSYSFGKSSVSSSCNPDYVTDEDAYNGHSFIRFKATPNAAGTDTTSPYPSLKGSGEIEVRTMVLVFRSKTGAGNCHSQGALVGYNGADVSLRVDTSGNFPGGAKDKQDTIINNGFSYLNGVKTTGTFGTAPAGGAPVVVTTMIARHTLQGSGYNHYSEFTPYLGANSSRPWGGDLCELMLFARALTDAERNTVENYLMAKWNPDRTTPHPAADCAIAPRRNLLPTATELDVARTGTVDLNGAEQTVAKLSGDGLIVNSSTNAATLVVTEGGDFHGQVRGNVRLVLPAGARQVLMRDGAELVLAGASGTTATVAADNPRPPTYDLAFWLDASKADTFETDESGEVTSWACCTNVCAAAKFVHKTGTKASYLATGWNGSKPCLHIADNKTYLQSATAAGGEAKSNLYTFFYVVRPEHTGTTYAFGPSDDVGLTITPWTVASGTGGYSVGVRGPSNIATPGDLIRINGTDYTQSTGGVGINPTASDKFPPLVLVMRACDSHKNASGTVLANRAWRIGSYNGSRGVGQYVAEAIGYSAQLTDAEILTVEKYLMDKWVNSGADWPVPETTAYDETCGLGVAGGATLDLGAGAVTLASLGGCGGTIKAGSLSVTDGMDFFVSGGKVDTVTVDGDLTLGSKAVARLLNGEGLDRQYYLQKALEVTGSVSGDFKRVEGVPTKWTWSRSGNVWSLGKNGMMIFVK